ncbi:MAG: stage II sporulation protein M [Pseudomonadota bacterium]
MTDLLKSYRFRDEREGDWKALEDVLKRAERVGVRGLSDEDMTALPRLYRQAVSSLSVARSISLDQNVIAYLEGLCSRAYFFVYGTRSTVLERVTLFFRRDWPQAVRSAGWSTGLAALCLFGTGLLSFALCMGDMDWYWAFNTDIMGGRTPNASTEYLRSTLYEDGPVAEELLGAFAGQLFSHNSQIALFAFALGFAFGVPTALLLMYNGAVLGAFVAVFTDRGLGYEVIGWLMIHGVTELGAIVLAGAAGFVIARSVAFPGKRSRMASAKEAGSRAAIMAAGCVVMLFFAALLEGFGRQMINSDVIRYTIAGSTLVIWLVYFYAPRRAGVSDDLAARS